MRWFPGFALIVASACNSSTDMSSIGTADGGVADAPFATSADAGAVMPIYVKAPPGPLPGVVVLDRGNDFKDVSSDQGGNIWAVTKDKVYFYRSGTGTPLTFDQSNGLAQGKTTWTDTYWFGTADSPSTQPVTFSAVAGGAAGQAFVGNIGMIGDRFDIDPATGAVQSIQSLAVTSAQQPDPAELQPQQIREVVALHAVVDLNGTLGGTTYFGGFHGTSALHGMTHPMTTSVCACASYEEHIHPFSADQSDVYGGDVHGLAITPEGDLWMGDRKAVYFLPQMSIAPDADFFQPVGVPGRPDGSVIDVFPGTDDFTMGIALDASGGIFVASFGNGLAYLSPGSYAATYWTVADFLPTNGLTGVDIDRNGEVWIGTKGAGVVRYTPSTHVFTYYTAKSGLPSDNIRQVFVDRYGSGPRVVLFATDNGLAVYTGP